MTVLAERGVIRSELIEEGQKKPIIQMKAQGALNLIAIVDIPLLETMQDLWRELRLSKVKKVAFTASAPLFSNHSIIKICRSAIEFWKMKNREKAVNPINKQKGLDGSDQLIAEQDRSLKKATQSLRMIQNETGIFLSWEFE